MSRHLIFSTTVELVRVPIDAVVYVTADGNYSSLMMADGETYTLTMQLGQIEQYMAQKVAQNDNRFVRIGRALIVNLDYISFINISRKKIVMSDSRTFRHELTASREALRQLKELIEQEAIA